MCVHRLCVGSNYKVRVLRFSNFLLYKVGETSHALRHPTSRPERERAPCKWRNGDKVCIMIGQEWNFHAAIIDCGRLLSTEAVFSPVTSERPRIVAHGIRSWISGSDLPTPDFYHCNRPRTEAAPVRTVGGTYSSKKQAWNLIAKATLVTDKPRNFG